MTVSEQIADGFETVRYCQDMRSSHASDAAYISGHFQGVCEYTLKMSQYFENVSNRSANVSKISDDTIKSIIGNAGGCTPTQALKVQTALKDQLKEVAASNPAMPPGDEFQPAISTH